MFFRGKKGKGGGGGVPRKFVYQIHKFIIDAHTIAAKPLGNLFNTFQILFYRYSQ